MHYFRNSTVYLKLEGQSRFLPIRHYFLNIYRYNYQSFANVVKRGYPQLKYVITTAHVTEETLISVP